MTKSQRILRWQLDADGGGTAWLFEEVGEGVKETKLPFDSLDNLPADLATAIREDGEKSGEVVLT